MSLFGQLRLLHQRERFPLEDFHTEIVAQVLRDTPLLAQAWLRGLGIAALSGGESLTVETQRTFPALAGHDEDSRPDMTIQISGTGRKELVFVESKVTASAGHTQISRYLEHLAHQLAEGQADRVTLVT